MRRTLHTVLATSFLGLMLAATGCSDSPGPQSAQAAGSETPQPALIVHGKPAPSDTSPARSARKTQAPVPTGRTSSLPAPKAPQANPDDAVEAFAHALSRGEMHVVWDALPASYQKDISDLVHAYAGNVDPDMWTAVFGLLGKAADVLVEKRDVILELPSLKNAPDFNRAEVARNWDHVVAPLRTIVYSDVSDIDALRELNVRQFLGTTGTQVMHQVQAIHALSPNPPIGRISQLINLRAKVASRDGDTAEVEITIPGTRVEYESLTLVEGKWIPSDMAEEWDMEMTNARQQLSQMSSEEFAAMKPQIMQILAGLDVTLDMMNQATTPEQFEQAAQGGMFQVLGGMMALSQNNTRNEF